MNGIFILIIVIGIIGWMLFLYSFPRMHATEDCMLEVIRYMQISEHKESDGFGKVMQESLFYERETIEEIFHGHIHASLFVVAGSHDLKGFRLDSFDASVSSELDQVQVVLTFEIAVLVDDKETKYIE